MYKEAHESQTPAHPFLLSGCHWFLLAICLHALGVTESALSSGGPQPLRRSLQRRRAPPSLPRKPLPLRNHWNCQGTFNQKAGAGAAFGGLPPSQGQAKNLLPPSLLLLLLLLVTPFWLPAGGNWQISLEQPAEGAGLKLWAPLLPRGRRKAVVSGKMGLECRL